MVAAYDPDNIFARILRGEIPCHKVFEDDVVLAFMDVMPQAEGHCLVLSKAPARTLFDLSPEDYAAVAARVQRIAVAVRTAFTADGLTVQQFNEAAGGQSVFHFHVHLLPRHDGVPMRAHAHAMADGAMLAAHAERIRAALT